MKTLEARFNVLCPATGHRPFSAVLDETSEGFVQIVREHGVAVGVTWIHPSCQDLTIEELATSAEDRRRFMSLCTRDGIEKAMSVAGGSEGKRVFPLLITDDDWDCLTARCASLLQEKVEIIRLLLRCLSSLQFVVPKVGAPAIEKLKETIIALWQPYLASVRREPRWSWLLLSDFIEMRKLAGEAVKPPRLRSAWEETVDDVLWAMDEKQTIEEAESPLKDFLRIARLLIQNEPKFWKGASIQALYHKALESIQTRACSEMKTMYSYSGYDSDALARSAKECIELADRFKELSLLPNIDEEVNSVFVESISHFESHSESLYDKAAEKSPPDESGDSVIFDAAAEIEDRSLTLSKLFEDL